MDETTGEYLPSANVVLEGTNMGASTDRRGEYRIVNVPLGTYSLVVSYIGYETFKEEVVLNAGNLKVKKDGFLTSSYVEVDAVSVYGLRQGQIKALSQQRESSNIKNVVDEEQMKLFPDVNSAEVLQRVPGVSVTRDGGEGRYILVRGTAARLNSTTINGEKIPSPHGDVRNVALDVIAADQLSSIDVTKAITPDMDGDAIGGSVNLQTKSALDYPGRIFNLTAGSGYNNLMGKGIYQASATYGDRFGAAKNIGLMVSGSYQRSNRGMDNNEMEWGSEETVDEVEIPWALRNMEMRDYAFQRNRMTLSSTLDYLLEEGHKLYVRGIYSRYEDSENRRRLRIRPEKGDYNSATNISEAAIDAQLRNRDQNQTISNIAAGGDHQFDNFKLDYRVSYSYSEEKEARHLEATFELDEDVDMMLNMSDTDNPQWTTNLGAGYEYDPAHFVFDAMEIHDNLTSDRDIAGVINLEIPYALGSNPGSFKLGGKVMMKEKDRSEDIREFGWEGDDDVLMSQFPNDWKDDNFLNDKYPLPPSPDTDKMWQWYNANQGGLLEGEILYEDTDGGRYDATEDIYAYYAMSTVHFGKLMVLGGLRHEITKIDYTGHEVTFNEDGDYEGTTTLKNEATFSNILPMLHFRYKLSSQTNVRAAFTQSIARPDYETLVPYRIIKREDEEMVLGNPDLEPTTSMNLDLMGEHYFQGIGILSAGVFYKRLDNIIYPSLYDMPDGPYEDYLVEQAVQGEEATLTGLEMNWQQQLTFLPGFLSGFGLYVNYTYTTSTATIGERDDAPLPGQAGNVANLALSYEKGGFTGRVSMNYHGSYLDFLGEDEDHDIIYDNHTQWDFSASQKIAGGVQFYLQAINLNDAPLRYYIGKTNRPTQREYYSWWIHAGFKYDL